MRLSFAPFWLVACGGGKDADSSGTSEQDPAFVDTDAHTDADGDGDTDTDADADGDADADADGDADTDTTADTGTTSPTLDIAGSWSDDFGTAHVISESTWTQTYGAYAPLVFHVLQFDNPAMFLVAENDAANAFNPGLFSRFDWTYAGGELYVCQTAYDAPTEVAAFGTARADDADPANAGCAYFAWSRLSP